MGDHAAASRRLALTDQCTRLPFDEAAAAFAIRPIEVKAVPITEPEDATHIAIATLALVKYIASWNFSHMVGPQAKRQLESWNRRLQAWVTNRRCWPRPKRFLRQKHHEGNPREQHDREIFQ